MYTKSQSGLFQFIDIYCERTDFLFWAEPANAITNVFLFLAGVYGLLLLKDLSHPTQKKWMMILSGNAMLIGIGSFLFHTLANRWSMLADVVPISIFMLLFLVWALRFLLNLPRSGIATAVVGFIAIGWALKKLLPVDFMNGSATYLHALAALMIVGHLIRTTHRPIARLFKLAIGIFTLSLTFRSMDIAVCEIFPLGTHFLWHTLNGCLLAICLKVIAKAEKPRLPIEPDLRSPSAD